ncbi:MAG: MBOAT family protein [Acidimicrobiia bacterium]|nr:MBOAT family protein [Acidimicrobiia bacterium]MBP8182144.1 MBOAT family protein [Acidimicrobiia bacterium]
MLFPTITFAVFFTVVLAVSWALLGAPRTRKVFLLAASYVFYGWWDERFLLLLCGSTLVNYVLARAVSLAEERFAFRLKKFLVIGAVTLNLALLGVFKYYGFFVESANELLHALGWDATISFTQLVLPVGISFFTFQALSYVIDVSRRDIPAAGLLDFAVYLAFFPQLVAGPIVRAKDFLPQLAKSPDPRKIEIGRGFLLIAGGLFKKVVIANFLATKLVDDVFALPDSYSGWTILLAVYGYAIQIYADFSGYSDIAIGCALLMGYEFPDNFDAPYRALSLQDFWRRWHISLSTWLRDYLYIPLGGNRKGPRRTYINLMITMLLGGLWHGAAWTFVVWGAIHGGGLAIERFGATQIDKWRASRAEPLGVQPERGAVAEEMAQIGTATKQGIIDGIRWFVVFNVVCFAWIFFRADSFSSAGQIIGRIASAAHGTVLTDPWLPVAIGAALTVQFVRTGLGARASRWFAASPAVFQIAIVAIGLLVIDSLGPEGVAPFIYFQF